MNRNQHLANAVLWAAAIVAAAILGAPTILTLTVLPALYVGSLLVAGERRRDCGCRMV